MHARLGSSGVHQAQMKQKTQIEWILHVTADPPDALRDELLLRLQPVREKE